MKFKEIKPGMVIHCPKEEDARALLEHLKELGYNVISTHPRIEWEQEIGEGIFYEIQSDDFWCWGRKRMEYFQVGRKITEFSDLIEPDSPINSDTDSPMTLDEAIAHCEEKADCTTCGQEHAQLAGWLKELKAIKDSPTEIGAVEVLEWIYVNGGTQVARTVFGYDRDRDVIDDSTILDIYSPEQIVAKITAYEAAKKEKPVEVEWVDICRIIQIQDNGFKKCVYEEVLPDNDGCVDYQNSENILKKYISEHEGRYIAVNEGICRVKEDR